MHWSPTINKEQKEVIRYILWNMVYVEGGTANLGDNNNYPVDVASFFINRYEVSQDEWYVIMGENPSNQHRRNYPVDQVNWFNAQRFTQKLSQLSGLPFRLPFEAEWEYAARGGLKTKNFIYAGSKMQNRLPGLEKNITILTYPKKQERRSPTNWDFMT